MLDTSEDCLSTAHLKTQEREQELEDLRREKRKWKRPEETVSKSINCTVCVHNYTCTIYDDPINPTVFGLPQR